MNLEQEETPFTDLIKQQNGFNKLDFKDSSLRLGNWIEKYGKEYLANIWTLFFFNKNKHKPVKLNHYWSSVYGFSTMSPRKINDLQYIFTLESNEIGGVIIKCSLVFYKENEEEDFKTESTFTLVYKNNTHFLYKQEVHVLQNLFYAITGSEVELKKHKKLKWEDSIKDFIFKNSKK